MSKVKTTYYKDGKPVKTVIEDYVPADLKINKTMAEKRKKNWGQKKLKR